MIKIERAEGDFARGYDKVVHGESAYFVWLNRGKQSIVLDLKNREDAALLARVIAASDVFIQNLAPGAAARAGLASAELRAANPRLITCDISGYGDDGPYHDMKAYDLLVQCESGLASITGAAAAPGRVGVSVADICCGMNAHAAILEALFVRERTGNGNGIAVSLFDGLADWMAVPLLHYDYAGKAPSRVGLAHPSIAPYGEFPLAGGQSIVIAVQNEREWRALCGALNCETIMDDSRFCSNVQRVANRELLDREIGVALANLDVAKIGSTLKAAGIAFGFVNEVSGLSSHPQLRRISVPTPSGPVDMPTLPVRWTDRSPFPGPVPALNSHGREIRNEFA
ncbi:L-carnitine dehydratase/bile acid-inducible protein F [Sphingobium indicum BiD32]|uniref:L-carnitine dehydratase/bile acid-inducible protein F n=1 Tax=Sphingobium indicum BiD32 TaxID=1301087 RepID=N1MS31_9SPHN|nr:L-carnitine dehydratase/bile acid-inducible protein F [Sphingobium indicum BiD32]